MSDTAARCSPQDTRWDHLSIKSAVKHHAVRIEGNFPSRVIDSHHKQKFHLRILWTYLSITPPLESGIPAEVPESISFFPLADIPCLAPAEKMHATGRGLLVFQSQGTSLFRESIGTMGNGGLRNSCSAVDVCFYLDIAMNEEDEDTCTSARPNQMPLANSLLEKGCAESGAEIIGSFKRTLPESFAAEDVRRKARIMFEQGYGYKSVASATSISVHTVRDWGRQFRQGHFRESFSTALGRYGSDAHEIVWHFHQQGLSLRQISHRTGISTSTCWNWIQKRRNLEEN